MDDAAAGQALEPRAEGVPQAGDEVGVRGAAVQEERELLLRGEIGDEPQLRGERVELQGARAIVQAVVVEPELAEGDEAARGPAGVDEGGEGGEDGLGPRGVGPRRVVGEGRLRVGAAGWCVLGLVVVLGVLGALAVGRVGVRGVEDGGGAGVDSGGGVDGAG